MKLLKGYLEDEAKELNRSMFHKSITPEDRIKFIQLVSEGFCKYCGYKLSFVDGKCHCRNDE